MFGGWSFVRSFGILVMIYGGLIFLVLDIVIFDGYFVMFKVIKVFDLGVFESWNSFVEKSYYWICEVNEY